MDEKQLMDGARKMFLSGSGRKDVLNYFTENGIAKDQANNMATEAYNSIRAVRQALVQAQQEQAGGSGASTGDKGSGAFNLVVGSLICIGGIVATMNTTSIWYGAVLVGGFMVIQGIIQMVD